jgi:hypothetical protein
VLKLLTLLLALTISNATYAYEFPPSNVPQAESEAMLQQLYGNWTTFALPDKNSGFKTLQQLMKEGNRTFSVTLNKNTLLMEGEIQGGCKGPKYIFFDNGLTKEKVEKEIGGLGIKPDDKIYRFMAICENEENGAGLMALRLNSQYLALMARHGELFAILHK